MMQEVAIGAFSASRSPWADDYYRGSVRLELLDCRIEFGTVSIAFNRVRMSRNGPFNMMLRELFLNLDVDDIGWLVGGKAGLKVGGTYVVIRALSGPGNTRS